MESLAILFYIGPFGITRTVVTSWGILLLLGDGSWLATPRLVMQLPGLGQAAPNPKDCVVRYFPEELA